MANLTMKVSAGEYQKQIDQLSDHMNSLHAQIEKYRDQQNRLDNIMNSEDVNYEKLKAGVDAQITAARRAYTTAANAKDALEKQLKTMSEAASDAGQTISSAVDTLEGKIETSLPVNGLLGD